MLQILDARSLGSMDLGFIPINLSLQPKSEAPYGACELQESEQTNPQTSKSDTQPLSPCTGSPQPNTSVQLGGWQQKPPSKRMY